MTEVCLDLRKHPYHLVLPDGSMLHFSNRDCALASAWHHWHDDLRLECDHWPQALQGYELRQAASELGSTMFSKRMTLERVS